MSRPFVGMVQQLLELINLQIVVPSVLHEVSTAYSIMTYSCGTKADNPLHVRVRHFKSGVLITTVGSWCIDNDSG